ncbi:chitin binding peritrophin-A domain-containing protein [Phthorimaea operculella]|nr:chitin binding peritrophin-A domain-containing protein [Phthorimaea operculella]
MNSAGLWLLWGAALLATASSLSIPVRQNPETLCIGQENFLRITKAADESCLHYYQCYAGRSYLMQCPEDTWFNEEEQVCDYSEAPARCLRQEPEPEEEPEPEPEEDVEPEPEEEVEPQPEEEVEPEEESEPEQESEVEPEEENETEEGIEMVSGVYLDAGTRLELPSGL